MLLLLKNEFNKKNTIILSFIKRIFSSNLNIFTANYFWLNIIFKNMLSLCILWVNYFYFVKKNHLEYMFNITLIIWVCANFFPLLFVSKNKILKKFKINYFVNLIKIPRKIFKIVIFTSIFRCFIDSFVSICFCVIYFVFKKNFDLIIFILLTLFIIFSVFIIKMYSSVKAKNFKKILIFITILKNTIAFLFSYSFFSFILYLMYLTRNNCTRYSIHRVSVDTARVNHLFTQYLLSKFNILICFFSGTLKVTKFFVLISLFVVLMLMIIDIILLRNNKICANCATYSKINHKQKETSNIWFNRLLATFKREKANFLRLDIDLILLTEFFFAAGANLVIRQYVANPLVLLSIAFVEVYLLAFLIENIYILTFPNTFDYIDEVNRLLLYKQNKKKLITKKILIGKVELLKQTTRLAFLAMVLVVSSSLLIIPNLPIFSIVSFASVCAFGFILQKLNPVYVLRCFYHIFNTLLNFGNFEKDIASLGSLRDLSGFQVLRKVDYFFFIFVRMISGALLIMLGFFPLFKTDTYWFVYITVFLFISLIISSSTAFKYQKMVNGRADDY